MFPSDNGVNIMENAENLIQSSLNNYNSNILTYSDIYGK